MLQKIAAVTGFSYNEQNELTMAILRRIEAKLPADVSENHPALKALIKKAEDDVNREGQIAIASIMKQVTAPPAEKTYKIARSLKGTRCKIPAANGVRYAFGPVWNAAVKAGTGIAIAAANRHKLNHQGLVHGVDSPETMDAKELCALIAPNI
jgi:hypothetical protein